ncbi:MerC domain-containing protein [Bdellovibrio sp. HCB209]|uniref:MerC domain-containing protein n=1 Tax=Bdellovibrio sp. HCB209 TaxID=3394354 RepID=UPI0039B3CFB7
MDEQILGVKPVIKSVETLSNTGLGSSLLMNPANASDAPCCDVDHTKHAEFAEETDIWDKLGMFLSTLCAIHCLATPLLIFALPVLGEAFESHWVHLSMAAVILPIGLFAFWSGYKHHRQRKVLSLGVAGLLMVCAGSTLPHEMVEVFEHDVVTILGSILLVTAHYLNRKACQCEVHPH